MIQVENLGKRFAEKWVFRQIGFHVPEGGTLAIVGPSGGGKSVLLKIIAGLLHPDEGTVRLKNEELGMLFQKNALFDSFTVLENLLFPMREKIGKLTSHDEMKALQLLEQVGLAGTENLSPDELSGGMQKRLGIARALIIQPKIILYDEPTAGLDPITSKKIAELMIQLKNEHGSTIIMVTNDMFRAYQIADQIHLLALGRLIQGGSPKEVQATQDPALRQFILGLQKGPLTASHAKENLA